MRGMGTASDADPGPARSLADLVHELNNVLSAILGYAEIVHADASDGTVDERDATQILAATRRAIELTDELAARIAEHGDGRPRPGSTGSEPGGAA